MAQTPLHDAVIRDDIEAVRALLGSGADPNARGERDFTPLHEAVMLRRLSIVPILLQHRADPKLRVPDHGDALDMAARRDDTEVLDLLCQRV